MTTNNENERRMVLEMLAEGKISLDDAQRLLEKLEEVGASQESEDAKAESRSRAKHLRIVSTGDESGDDLNLRIPLGLVRAGLTIESFLPVGATVLVGTKFSELTSLDTDYLRENLDDLDMRFDSEDGSTLHLYAE